jgi:ABC-2 type transport system ATP-binding protein
MRTRTRTRTKLGLTMRTGLGLAAPLLAGSVLVGAEETHVLEEVHALCNRAMIISDGRMLVDDTPHGLLTRSRYHNAVTMIVDQPERVASVLSELPQARKVEIREGELTVFPAEGASLFEVISDRIREHDWLVHELRLEAGRMDEVFRQVTVGEEQV